MHKNEIVFFVTTLLIIGAFSPIISSKTDIQNIDNENLFVTSIDPNKTATSSLTFYTFDKTGRKQNTVELPYDIAIEIKELFDELNNKIINEPVGIETQDLKNNFINLLDEYGLISDKQSKENIFSLLNPGWIKQVNKNLRFKNQSPDTSINPLSNSFFGKSFFCSVSGAGTGIMMPLFMFPRPRAVALWFSIDAISSVASLLTSKGFLAGGVQSGLLLGFMGIGLTYAIPGETIYGFIGYSLFAGVAAEHMEFIPPNNEPVITGEAPSDGMVDVPISLSKLSFKIGDSDGDLMSYIVYTDPDIGAGQGTMKKNGEYSIPISGLESDKKYTWTVVVSDGKSSVEKKFSFITIVKPFDPYDEGWLYRKKITINHTQVVEDQVFFPVLISIIDNDLRDKAQFDGDDILFMESPGVANKVNHEIEDFDGSTGELVAWVRIPSISSSQDTEFYMYYGNSSSNNQQFPEKVWDNHFKAVWHLNNDPTGNIIDSTVNDNNCTSYGLMNSSSLVEGKTGKSLQFDGLDDYVSAPNSNSLCPIDVTLSSWYKPLGFTEYGCFISKASYDYWYNADGKTYGFYISPQNDIKATFEREDSKQFDIAGNFSPQLNQWHYLTLTYDDVENVGSFYVNGVLIGTVGPCHPTVLWYEDPWDFIIGGSREHTGATEIPNHFQNCMIDEVHVLNTAKTSGWIATEYNNQKDPTSFLNVGPEESNP